MKRLALVLAFSATLLTACQSTKPKQTVKAKQQKVAEPTQAVKKEPTAQDYLARAAEAKSQRSAAVWYTRAVDAWLQQQDYAKAQALLQQIDLSQLTEQMQQQYHLFNAETLIALTQYDLAWQQIAHINSIVGFEKRLFTAKAKSAELSRQYLFAATALINLARFTPQEQQTDLSRQIWKNLIHLKPVALQRFQHPERPILNGWLSLLAITRQHADSPATMLLNIRHWQAQYPNHPAATQLPEDLTQALNAQPYKPKDIAVVLPLSGKFQRQGKAVQQGILAAFYQSQNIKPIDSIKFYDSETADFNAVAAGHDFVIGPLLKDKVRQAAERFKDTPILLLNQSEDFTLLSNQYAISLSPESEAQQAAIRLAEQGYKRPVIIAANNSYGRRVVKAFNQSYKALTDVSVEVEFFANRKAMQKAVEGILGTKQSKERIKTIKRLFNNHKDFNADARNRQDIDMIYVVGNSTQTRIVKPYIDVNTAPFDTPPPIIATSRSHSAQLNMADLRDLSGVSFSDMPWLLPGNAQQSALNRKLVELWGENNEQLSRLFAYGYDAYELVPYLAQMRAFPGFRLKGLTGKLYANQDGNLNRELSWARFDKGRVVNIVTN